MSETDKKPEEKTTGGTETETDTPKTDNEHQRKINVGNLPSDVTEQQLRDHFSGHEIERVDIFHYRKYTLALLLFKDKEAASKAIAEKDGSIFRNRRLRIHLEYLTIRHIKRDVIVTVVEDENMTEEQLWDKVKGAEVEPASVLIFHPLGYISLAKDSDKAAMLEKLTAAGFNAHDVNQRDQNQHLDIWRAAKLFHRNRNRVQLLNIPNKWIEDKEEMKKQCAEGGTITEAVSNNANQNQNASNYARIFYETEEQAAKAAAAINNRVVDGKRIYALHLGSALIPNYKTSVYVTPLDKAVTEEQVYDHFKQFGDIEFVNRRNCNDAAIICFKNADSAEKAVACVTFPAPTEEDKEATKEVAVKQYNGPLVLRPQAIKRKLKTTEDGKPIDPEERSKEQQEVLKKLQAYHPVFVGNVPLNCPPLELKRYFAQHGPIKFMFSPQILPYRTSAPHPVKTFIIYYNIRPSAQNACKFLDHKFFGGHRLHVLPLRGDVSFDAKKTIKMTKIPYLSEDALFKKIKPYVGKINRIVKKSRLAAYIELNDPADVEKVLNVENADHPLSKGKMELIKAPVNVRLYNENDSRVLGGIAKIISKNPDMLKKTPLPGPGPMNKRPRLNGPGFNQGPGGFNSNMNNPQAIQDLLRLAFMSGKNVGESLASNQSSFNAPDPPIANSGNFGDGGFGNRNNRNNQGGNFRGQGRNMNQNNRGNNANNFGGNNSDGGNFQNAPGNTNRGGQNMNRGNQHNNQNRGNNNDGGNTNQNRNNLNQNQGTVARVPQNKQQGGVGGNNNLNQNNRNNQGGGNLNRNQNVNRPQNNRNNNNFDNDSFGGGNNFGNNRNNNFANDNFSNDNFGNNRNNNDNFSNDNFSGNNRGGNFGGNNRNQNDNFNNKSFGSNSGGGGGGNNRFNNSDGGQFNSNFNRNQNNRFDDDNNSFGGNQKGGNSFNQNRQNKNFNSSGNQGGGSGGGMSFGEFNSNTNRNFGGSGGGNSNFGTGNAGGNKWNSNSQQSNTGSRLAGSIFSRRF